MVTIQLDELIQALDAPEKQALAQAANLCVARQGQEILIEDYLLALIDASDSFFTKVLQQFSLSIEAFLQQLRQAGRTQTSESRNPVFSKGLIQWLEDALIIAKVELNLPGISSLSLLLAILQHQERYGATAYGRFLSQIEVCELISLWEGLRSEGASHIAVTGESALAQYTKNYTQLARENKLDPVFCRDEEINQLIDILSRRRKNNPILVGEPGVGKTAIVEGLAQLIVQSLVPPSLQQIELIELDMGLLQAGASVKGEFERRLKCIIEEVNASPKPIVLFIDEAHTLIGAGGNAGGSDAANLLKPALARGELRTIAATTWSEYNKYFEKDPALARRFQPVSVVEPTVTQALVILRGLVGRYEKMHQVYLRDDAVVAAANLSARYLAGRQLPDKAIDVLDTACARVKNSQFAQPQRLQELSSAVADQERALDALLRDSQHGLPVAGEVLAQLEITLNETRAAQASLMTAWQVQQKKVQTLLTLRQIKSIANPEQEIAEENTQNENTQGQEQLIAEIAGLQKSQGVLVHFEVTPAVIAEVISGWTAIPVSNLIETSSQQIMDFRDRMQQRIKGQAYAIELIDRAIKATSTGLGNPDAPTGVFLLVGPSGVGKTETAIAVSDLLYGGERFLTTINMSEFQEKHALSRLIGSPPGYVGYGEGGVLTEAVRQRPYSVILLDEVEKADPDILNLFYQVFDKGIANDGEGRAINFRNTLVLMTSNLASEQIMQLMKSETPATPDVITEAIRPILAKHFKPALLARMTIIPYLPIAAAMMRELVIMRCQKLSARLAPRGIDLMFDDAVIDAITSNCTRTDTGARNIDFLLNHYLLPAISERLLQATAHEEKLNSIRVMQDEQGNFDLVIG